MRRLALLLLVCALVAPAMAQDKPELSDYQKARAAYGEASALQRAKKYTEALAAFEALVQAYPDYDLADDALNQAATAAYNVKDYEKQLALLQRILDDFPKSSYAPGAAYSRASTLYGRLKKYSDAAEAYEIVGTRFPGYGNTEYSLGMVVLCRRAAKEWDKLVAAVDAASTQMPLKSSRYMVMMDAKIEALTNLGQYDLAKAACEQFAQIATTDFRVGQRYDNIGRKLYSQKKYAEAAEFYRLAATVEAYHDGIQAIQRAAQALERTEPKSTEAAIAVYRELAEKYPKSDRVHDAVLRVAYLQGTILKDREAEAATLRGFLESYPKSIYADQAHYRLVQALYALKKMDEVVTEAAALVEKFPKSELGDDALWTAAEAHRIAKEDDKAKALYQRIVDEYPGHSRIDAAKGRLK